MRVYLKVQSGFVDMLNSPRPDVKEWAFMLCYVTAIALVLLGWTALSFGAPVLALFAFVPGVLASVGSLVILWRR
jgi:hypothetical protein